MPDTSWWIDSNELDDEQTDIISLPPDGNFLVIGPPGSGKTNLLLLRASYLVDSRRPNILVLMFTRSLREFVVRGAGNYSVAQEKVQTIMHWIKNLIREQTGRNLPEGKNFEETRKAHATEAARIFDQKPALQHHLDCILVDEVQDCLPEEIELFFRAAKQVFFVGDHRQQIYSRNGILESLGTRVHKSELTKHYRNGEEICKVADTIGKNFGEPPLLGSCNYDETKAKSSVTFEQCSDDAQVYQRLSVRLLAQLKAYPDELLGIACPKNDDVRRLRAALETISGIAPYVLAEGKMHNAANPDQRICICTMHDAKGLEFRAMHLAFVEHMKGETQKRVAFTSVTRAKTSLSVYHVAPMPGYFEQAREKLAPPKPPPSVSALFPAGKKKK
ncbi:MAG TPA: UvrD-helicase domain-containing protein [Polyangiaceae bacterium]|nr:UvrD-helicase domain-containing protein [Polyangiaceae bacterium]